MAKSYRENDAEEIVRLIHRNFREVNVKDYGERAMATPSSTQGIGCYIIDTLEYNELFFGAERIAGRNGDNDN